MGRYISCGIATQIIVDGNGCLKENKKDLLRRIDKVFNLKYYEEGLSDNDDCICLYLKEDLFNKNFKNLLLELNDLDLFTNYFYDNIKAISSNSYNMSQKDRKKAVCDYLEKNFDLKITRSYEKRVDGKNNYDYYLDNVLELNDEISFFYENYLNCTDMGDGAQFNDNITNINGLYMSLNHIPLYFDFNKIISEDIINIYDKEKDVMELEYNLICDFIKLRNKLGLTQKQMADEAHVVREMIAVIENRKKHPQINTLIKILKPFGYTLSITKINKGGKNI